MFVNFTCPEKGQKVTGAQGREEGEKIAIERCAWCNQSHALAQADCAIYATFADAHAAAKAALAQR